MHGTHWPHNYDETDCHRTIGPPGPEMGRIHTYKGGTIVSRQNDVRDVEYFQPCSHEEADTRILLHVAHCARQGLRKLVIRTVDTDVVVLAIGHSLALQLDEPWVRLGVGTQFRQIAIQEIVKMSMKKHRCSAMLSVVCLAASATEKKSTWLALRSCPSAIYAFLDLYLQPVDVSSDTLEGIERFLVVVYSRTCSASGVWTELLAHGYRTMENIPPTKAALLQRVRRAA